MPNSPSANTSTNLLVIVGSGSDGQAALPTAEFDALSEALTQALEMPVLSAYVDAASPSVGEGILQGIARYQPRRVVVLPLFVGASAAKKNNLRMILDAARDRFTDISLCHAPLLGTHAGVISAYRQLLQNALAIGDQTITAPDTTLLVVGRGSRDAESNAEIYATARRLWEEFRFGSVEIAFHRLTKPDIAAGISRCIASGARRLVVVPYVLYERPIYEAIKAQVQQIRAQHTDSNVDLVLTEHLGIAEGILEAVRARYLETETQLITMLRDFYPFSDAEKAEIHLLLPHSHNSGHSANPHQLDIQALLPPRYQGEVVVSAAPMSAADLIFDAAGKVAWDQIWGDFCDLALAGGPPHRGTLLEPVAPEAVAADPDGYSRVIAELERGIKMITGLPVITKRYAGWIGIQCDGEAMALWLLRAIVVENISVRREDEVLYLPASPQFRLEQEIKNVITVVAKTHHYWVEHLNNESGLQ